MNIYFEELQKAFQWRKHLGLVDIKPETEAARIFHGPGDSKKHLKSFAIDRFGSHYWVTQLKNIDEDYTHQKKAIVHFLESELNSQSVSFVKREKNNQQDQVELWSGSTPQEAFMATEENRKYLIKLQKVAHPGLFLDHIRLRNWLQSHTKNLKVLNTFSYTASLSIAAGLGEAQEVVSVDLSKNYTNWAKENWKLNELDDKKGIFIAEDTFEYLTRAKKAKRQFDVLILDPPSFARGKKINFSTQKDLAHLHHEAIQVLKPGGYLITSINSQNISRDRYLKEILSVIPQSENWKWIKQIEQPETFTTALKDDQASRYLKGWILQRSF